MRYIIFTLFLFATIIIVWINVKLYSENYNKSEIKADIIFQLNFLEDKLKNDNLALVMQKMFPEGFVFINALYGLTWSELVLSEPKTDSTLKKRAIQEIIFAYNEIKSEYATWTFDQDLTPKYGIFYCGWKNYLLSKLLSIDTTFEGHEFYVKEFTSECDTIVHAINLSKSPFLQSYDSQSWPADMFVAIASLSNHDKIFKKKYTIIIDYWIQKTRNRLDSVTKMFPHKVDSKTGFSIQGSRGSSMSLILRMLSEIDPNLAKEQYTLFKKNFVTTTLGLPSIREFPKGHQGRGDIDSGPIIFGVGFSGTIVTIGTFSTLNDEYLAEKQYKTINAFGLGFKTKNKKKYLLGKLPMADAFIAWGRSSGLKYKDQSLNNTDKWRIPVNLISSFIIILLWIIYFQKKLKNKIKTAFNRISRPAPGGSDS